MKIKLPRKRKKKYLKEKGAENYMGMRIVNEIKFEENPIRQNTLFPEFQVSNGQVKTLRNY